MPTIPNILSVLTFLPLVGALVIMLLLKRPQDLPEHHGEHGDEAHGEPDSPTPPPADPRRALVNWVALGFALANFVISLFLFAGFDSRYLDPSNRNMQFMEDRIWITMGNLVVHYRVGVDGVSMLLLVLTTFLMVLSVLFSFGVKQRLKEFMVFLLLLETGMIGVFCALDLVLFYTFWEAMLIPMYFLIGIFGHENRIYAAIKFFLYTFAGSVFMLIAIVAIYQITNSFDVLALSDPSSAAGMALTQYGVRNPQLMLWLFGAFALAFMIKVPMFPFHTWLPDAHVEAPTAGSVILAGVLLKMGTYGFIRFCLPLFPTQAHDMAWLFITLAIIGIVYGSLVAAVQPDAKKLVAYSSVAHLGFVVLGIFTFTRVGMMGALVQNINHGISTPMLFFLVGMLYERRHTRQIDEFGGLKKVVPMLATMLLIATLASVAVPFFNGFVGEFPILLGSWTSKTTGYWPTAIAATGMILSAVYMLWWFQRLMLGPVTKPVNRHLPDLSRIEWLVLAPLAAIIFWIGLGSHFWTKQMDTSVNTLLPIHQEMMDESAIPMAEHLEKERHTNQMEERTPSRHRSNAPSPGPSGRPESGSSGGPLGENPGGPSDEPNGAQPGGPSSSGGAPAPGNVSPSKSPTNNGTGAGTGTSPSSNPNAPNPPPNGNTGAGLGMNAAPGGAAGGNPAGGTNAGATAPNGAGGSGKPSPVVPANPGQTPPASPQKNSPGAPGNKGARRTNGHILSHKQPHRTEVHA